jgi:hypothetical protein
MRWTLGFLMSQGFFCGPGREQWGPSARLGAAGLTMTDYDVRPTVLRTGLNASALLYMQENEWTGQQTAPV